MSHFLFQTLRSAQIENDCVLATVLSGEHAGKKLLTAGGETVYTSADEAVSKALSALCSSVQANGVQELPFGRVFCERFGGAPHLVVCGGGHVSIPIVKGAKGLGFHVTGLEDRPHFAENLQNAGADTVLVDDFAHSLDTIAGGPNTYFVVVTRGHEFDTLCLRRIFAKPYAYVGMMGSKVRVGMLKQRLLGEGFTPEVLATLHAPIGVPIDAETPEEIAISVLAELTQVRRSKNHSDGYTGDLLQALVGAEAAGEPVALATIVSRMGSAPRSVGTKLVAWQDGSFEGTIGGGRMEYDTIQMAQEVLAGKLPNNNLFPVQLKQVQGVPSDMICGGDAEIFIEIVGKGENA